MASSAFPSDAAGTPASATANLPSKPVIFFDNAQKHIDEMRRCPNVYAVKVPESKARMIRFDDENFRMHIYNSRLSPNFMNFITWATRGSDAFDAFSGLNEEHLHILENWLERTSNLRERWAIFDFDRTISKIEGFNSGTGGMVGIDRSFKEAYEGTDYTPDDITAEEYMAYLCGGHRLPLLKKFIELCKENGVQIVILTNNGACKSDPKIFDDLLSVIGLNPGEFELLCSVTYKGEKAVALSQQLEKACGAILKIEVEGGNRRSHRNRRNRRRRTQRKTTK